MTHGQGSEFLTEEEVRDFVASSWDEVDTWHARTRLPWLPEVGSDLWLDGQTGGSHTTTYLAWTSLAIGTDCLVTAFAHCLNFGPTLFSMHPLLRTSMFSGAQTIWLLAPADQSSRRARAQQLSRTSYRNHKVWAEGLTEAATEAVDARQLEVATEQLRLLLAGHTQGDIKQTDIVRKAAEHLFEPSDNRSRLIGEVLTEWRSMSGVAHALPWEMSTRPGNIDSLDEGYRTTTVVASWCQLQGALSQAYVFLRSGWKLLDARAGKETGSS